MSSAWWTDDDRFFAELREAVGTLRLRAGEKGLGIRALIAPDVTVSCN